MIAAASSLSSVRCFSNSSLPCLTISWSSSSTASCGTPRRASGGGRRSVRGFRSWRLVILAGRGANSLRNWVGISKSSGELVRWGG